MELDKAETGIGYMVNAYKMGGPFMHVITFMAILALVITGVKVFRMLSYKEYNSKLLSLISMAGLFALAFGMFSQIIGVIGALEAIRIAEDISPQLVYAGAIISFYTTIWGFMVFFVTILIYFILNEIVKHKRLEQ